MFDKKKVGELWDYILQDAKNRNFMFERARKNELIQNLRLNKARGVLMLHFCFKDQKFLK